MTNAEIADVGSTDAGNSSAWSALEDPFDFPALTWDPAYAAFVTNSCPVFPKRN